jgi:hypothetical protein
MSITEHVSDEVSMIEVGMKVTGNTILTGSTIIAIYPNEWNEGKKIENPEPSEFNPRNQE